MQVRRFSPDMKSKPEGHPGMYGVVPRRINWFMRNSADPKCGTLTS